MTKFFKLLLKPLINISLPLIYVTLLVLRKVRDDGVHKYPAIKKTLLSLGVFPVIDHYYEPQFKYEAKADSVSCERDLPGIDWNIQEQLELLKSLNFSKELTTVPLEKSDDLHFYMNNNGFSYGDSEYWYQIIRLNKPKRIFEVGSGNSTLMARNAIVKNKEEDPDYNCKHVCIEPYEMRWLGKIEVSVLRKRVEELETSFFSELGDGDILFIDSSHMIRPTGDVLYEFLQILPTLNKGVIVHVHDIFSPRNYPDRWLKDEVKFWNEQYLLEAFLSHNSDWAIIGALNFLKHNHFDQLNEVCPLLTPGREPGSFYIQKIT